MRYPNALWIGPTVNQVAGGMVEVLGLVQHVQMGTEAGTESWFKNPASKSSSHFLNPKTGPLRQMVDTRDRAWAEVDGNKRWLSVENEALKNNEQPTPSQVQNLVMLYSWINQVYRVPFQVTDSVDTPGYGWHGMGGVAWGNHPDCPGEPLKAIRHLVVEYAASTPVHLPGAPWNGRYLAWKYLSTGSDVAHVQQKLKERGYTEVGAIDGKAGRLFDSAVRHYQRDHSLDVDGVVGRHTWDSLENT